MTDAELNSLRMRFRLACGYCGVTETQNGVRLTVDHFQPTSQQGSDDATNWVYACFACNTFIGAFWVVPPADFLLHPLRDDLNLHLAENEDGSLTALSSRGRLHIERLHLNRLELVAHRREKRLQRECDQRIDQLISQLEQMNKELAELRAKLNQ